MFDDDDDPVANSVMHWVVIGIYPLYSQIIVSSVLNVKKIFLFVHIQIAFMFIGVYVRPLWQPSGYYDNNLIVSNTVHAMCSVFVGVFMVKMCSWCVFSMNMCSW